MNLKNFAIITYIIFAVAFVLANLISDIVVAFIWAPLFVSFICFHYLLFQKKVTTEITVPNYISVLLWTGIISLSLLWFFVGFILFVSFNGDDTAVWALLGTPFLLIPGITVTILFFFFKTAVVADISANTIRKQSFFETPNIQTFSYVKLTGYFSLFVILIGTLVYFQDSERTNFFGSEKIYTIQSSEFNQHDSIFYIQAEPHPPKSSRPYSIIMRANSGKLDKAVGSIHNWIPSLVLYHEGKLYSLFNKEEIDGVLVRDLNQPKNVGGKWVYDGNTNETFSGDIVVVGGEVYVFEFISPTCQIGVYNNCFGNLYPANYAVKNAWYNSRVRKNVSYAEFKSSNRQTYQYLTIKNGELVPGNSQLFDEVSNEIQIIPIVLDDGVSLPPEDNTPSSNNLETLQVSDTESTYAVVGYVSTIKDAGLGGKIDCPALLVTDATPLFSERLTTINEQHYERIFSSNFIDEEVGTDQFILFGWNWQRDLTNEERMVVENSNSNVPVTFSVSELSDPGPRGYDVCDLHETFKLKLVSEQNARL